MCFLCDDVYGVFFMITGILSVLLFFFQNMIWNIKLFYFRVCCYIIYKYVLDDSAGFAVLFGAVY